MTRAIMSRRATTMKEDLGWCAERLGAGQVVYAVRDLSTGDLLGFVAGVEAWLRVAACGEDVAPWLRGRRLDSLTLARIGWTGTRCSWGAEVNWTRWKIGPPIQIPPVRDAVP